MNRLDISGINSADFSIFDTSFNAGVRPCDKSIIGVLSGRKKNGFLYIYYGRISFLDKNENVIHMASSGDLVYIPKGAKYKLKYIDQTHFSLVNFNAVSENGTEILFSDGIVTFLKQNYDAKLTSLFDKVESLRFEEDAGAVFRQKELIYRLFAYLVEPWHNRDQRSARIMPGVKILEQRYLENFEISELATACYMSESNFRKLFSECFGVSPVQYRNRLRLKRAEVLLAEGEYTVSEVALLSGFSNESYFCRLYKKMIGRTPRSSEKML